MGMLGIDPLTMMTMQQPSYGLGIAPTSYLPGMAQAPQHLGFGYAPPLIQGEAFIPQMPVSIPGLGSGPLSMFANMAFASPIQQMMASRGLLPVGINPGVNFFDRMQNYQFQQLQMQMQAEGAMRDQMSMMQTFRGLSNLMGVPFGADQYAAASSIASGISAFAPFIAPLNPRLYESLLGPRGSAMMLQQNVALEGRYRPDVITGLTGLSAEGISATTDAIRYAIQNDVTGEFSGLTLGEAGLLYGEMGRRGFLPGGGTAGILQRARGTAEFSSLSRIAQGLGVDLSGDLSATDMTRLTADGNFSAQLRSIEGGQVAQALREQSRALNVMRQIFGDAGNPDAPLPQIFQALQQLSQGQVGQLDPAALENTLRNLRNISRMTGLGMEGTMRLAEFAGGSARGMGLGGDAAFQATVGSSAFAGALSQMGLPTAPGMPGLDALTQQDVSLRNAAYTGRASNQFGALLRLFGESTNTFEQTPGGEEAAAIYRALVNREQTYTVNGQERLLTSITDAEMIRVFSPFVAGGANTLQTALGQSAINQQESVSRNLGSFIRGGQNREAMLTAQAELAGKLASAPGVDGDMGKAYALAGKLIEAYGSATPEQRVTPGALADVFGGVLGNELNMNPISARELGVITSGAVGSVASRYGMSFQQFGILFDPRYQAQASQLEKEAQAMSTVQRSLEGVGEGGFISRVVQAIQRVKPGDQADALSTILSGMGIDVSQAEAAIKAANIPGVASISDLTSMVQSYSQAALTGDQKAMAQYEKTFNDIGSGLRKASMIYDVSGVSGDIKRVRSLSGDFSSFAAKSLAAGAMPGEEAFSTALSAAGLTGGGSEFVARAEAVSLQLRDNEVLAAQLAKTPGALQAVDRATQAARTLRDLAEVYTGGDLDALLGGQIPGSRRNEVMAQVRAAMQDIEKGMAAVDTAASVYAGKTPGELQVDVEASRTTVEDFLKNNPMAGSAEATAQAMISRMGAVLGDKEAKAMTSLVKGREREISAASQAFSDLRGIVDPAHRSAVSTILQGDGTPEDKRKALLQYVQDPDEVMRLYEESGSLGGLLHYNQIGERQLRKALEQDGQGGSNLRPFTIRMSKGDLNVTLRVDKGPNGEDQFAVSDASASFEGGFMDDVPSYASDTA